MESTVLFGLPLERKVDGMAEKYVKEKLKKVKRRLFCDEPMPNRSTDIVKSTRTPLSYSPTGSSSRTVFFMGYKQQTVESDEWYCATCFANIHCISEEKEIPTKYLYTGEISEQEFLKKGEPFTTCTLCNKYLTIVRPYSSDHLDFA